MTDTPKHTPGPWKLNDEKNGENIIVPANAKTGDETCIAMALEADDRDWAETMSNARLIAAPELLEDLLNDDDVCERHCDLPEGEQECSYFCKVMTYKQLIAKAKGEPNP